MTDTSPDPVPPIVRTKTNLLPAEVDRAFHGIIERLHREAITPEEYKKLCEEFFAPKLATPEFRDLAARAMKAGEQLELLRRHVDDKRYTVLIYRVDEGEVHPPHHHHNVISTQIVMRGKLRLREYERVTRDGNGKLRLKPVTDTIIGEGDVFHASEWVRNVHWFQAVGGPTLVFNTNARGFEATTFDLEDEHFGRRYLDPTRFDKTGVAVCEEFDGDEAARRFAGVSLDTFAIPGHAL